jgi:hypothetical protein
MEQSNRLSISKTTSSEQKRKIANLMLLILAAVLTSSTLSGCRTLRSEHLVNSRIDPATHKRDSISYALPMAYLKVVIDKPDATKSATITISEEYLPDPNHFYSLELIHSPWADDNFDVKVEDKTQLIDKITNSHQDRTGDIAQKVVEFGVKAVRAGQGLPLSVQDRSFEKGDTFHLERHVSLEDGLRGVPLGRGFNFRLNRIISAKDTSNIYFGDRNKPVAPSSHNKVVYYRTGLPYIATVSSTNEQSPVRSELVLLPNESPIQILNLKRGALVKVDYEIDFTSGMPTQVKSTRPSEILAVVTLPVTILETVAEALPFRIKVDNATQSKALFDAQQEALKSHAALIDERIKYIEKLEEAREAGLVVNPANGQLQDIRDSLKDIRDAQTRDTDDEQ